MTNYREILRLQSLGLNKSQIAQSLGCSRTTVIQVLNVAEEKGSAILCRKTCPTESCRSCCSRANA